ncbi:MAG: hypothetical protein RLZZ316_1440 [Bacteroidota bacterium]|jgi:hypothetical protein
MKKNLLLIVALAAVFMSCNSTRITKTWKDPEASVSIDKLNKVLVVALLKDETSRRVAEDKMAAMLNGKGVVSYSYLTNDVSQKDEKAIQEKIKADGFDGAVTLRLIDVEKDVDYTPGMITSYPMYYRSFSGYYMRSWQMYATPDRYTTTKTFTIETNVYSITKDKIIWSGLTESTNPGGVGKLSNEVTNAVYKRMVKEGFIK